MLEPRSGCPINGAVELLGDRWTLLVLRDVIFADRRYFRALLLGSREGIASNILADRLVRLVEGGLLSRGTAARGQRARYSLTEAGIQTLPIIWAMGNWGLDWAITTDDLARQPELLRDEGAPFLAALMDQLRLEHLQEAPPSSDITSPLGRLRGLGTT